MIDTPVIVWLCIFWVCVIALVVIVKNFHTKMENGHIIGKIAVFLFVSSIGSCGVFHYENYRDGERQNIDYLDKHGWTAEVVAVYDRSTRNSSYRDIIIQFNDGMRYSIIMDAWASPKVVVGDKVKLRVQGHYIFIRDYVRSW